MANTKADHLNADQLREAILEAVQANPEGVKTGELAELLFKTKDEAEFKRLSARLSWALGTLKKAKRIDKKGGMNGMWLVHTGRPQPQVHDLPENGKRPYTRRGPNKHNGAFNGNGTLVGYILRDIRAKLSELEALGY